MTINPTVQAFRAITAVYFRSLLPWLVIGVVVVFALLYAAVFWLVSIDGWWGLLFLLLVPLTLVSLVLIVGLWVAIRLLLPRPLDQREHATVKTLTDKLASLIEQAGTPYPLIGFFIAKDVLRRRESSFIKQAIENSSSLKGDFAKVRRIFEKDK